MRGVRSTVLAHAGGSDEIMIVLVPIAIFTGLLWLVNKKAGGVAASSDVDGEGVPGLTSASSGSAFPGPTGTVIPPHRHADEDESGAQL